MHRHAAASDAKKRAMAHDCIFGIFWYHVSIVSQKGRYLAHVEIAIRKGLWVVSDSVFKGGASHGCQNTLVQISEKQKEKGSV